MSSTCLKSPNHLTPLNLCSLIAIAVSLISNVSASSRACASSNFATAASTSPLHASAYPCATANSADCCRVHTYSHTLQARLAVSVSGEVLLPCSSSTYFSRSRKYAAVAYVSTIGRCTSSEITLGLVSENVAIIAVIPFQSLMSRRRRA